MEIDINILVVATVVGGQAVPLAQLLTNHGFAVTEIASQVSLVEQPVTTLLIGTRHDRLAELIALMHECCPARIQFIPARLEPGFIAPPLMVEALQGGATLYAFEVEQFIQI